MEYRIDAANKILGRLATEVAVLLRGKNTAQFDPAKLAAHKVTVFNTDHIKVTGRKMEDKIYLHHTGFHGGQRAETLNDLMKRDSRLVLKRAVMGMLPKNKLRARFIKNLILVNREMAGDN